MDELNSLRRIGDCLKLILSPEKIAEGRTNEFFSQWELPPTVCLIQKRLSLTELEVFALTVGLAVEVHEGLRAAIQSIVGRSGLPTVGMISSLFSSQGKSEGGALLLPGDDIFTSGLMFTLASEYDHPFAEKSIKLNERILELAMGRRSLPPSLAGLIKIRRPEKAAADLEAPFVKSVLKNFTEKDTSIGYPVLWCWGKNLRDTINEVNSLSDVLKTSVFEISLRSLLGDRNPAFVLQEIFLEAFLADALVHFSGADPLISGEEGGRVIENELARLMARYEWPVIFSSTRPHNTTSSLLAERWKILPCHPGDMEDRIKVWTKELKNYPIDKVQLTQLAQNYELADSSIRKICVKAKAGELKTAQEIQNHIETQTEFIEVTGVVPLTHLGLKEDLILPKEQMSQIIEIEEHIRMKHQVLSDWGFGKRAPSAWGTNILFSGPSGTGKTMATGILARQMGLRLFKVDLSMIVSKYIGETEKSLCRVFDTYVQPSNIVFFDEADALFGKRTETKDSHDRYANIEVNYLLQKMEEHRGIVVLSTNLAKNMDKAFVRRMTFSLEFPFPEKEQRLRIWKSVFPKQVPLQQVDFDFLAEKVELSGGGIINVAMTAAFDSARKNSRVGMTEILQAVKKEYKKNGLGLVGQDFGSYEKQFIGSVQ